MPSGPRPAGAQEAAMDLSRLGEAAVLGLSSPPTGSLPPSTLQVEASPCGRWGISPQLTIARGVAAAELATDGLPIRRGVREAAAWGR
ncbi:hypothetical protein PR202_gb03266 [Eleusine coracana subsp. coracana]|uniref:Uncharacterized protein n=1 Tax=Eleusine coracana subsp. coracana TaxID=191504 RepID=A0AAV5E156_ELECO|nr:hypothetical protein PR202_gb03186 [Eleusine coracana subsp. coracana]GJN16294.1 hypothetical protein PR202_gb03266 [Eleusine coracana subsp. coracana]